MFRNQSIELWIKAILRPHSMLAIPERDTHEFQIMAAITMDHIWFARNQFIHKAVKSEVPTMTQITLSSGTSFGLAELYSISSNLLVEAAVLSDSESNIISAATRRLPPVEANVGEAHAALLAVKLAA
jgi:hypothetical protein